MMPPGGGSARWSNSLLESSRQVCDPPADDVVRRLFADGEIRLVNDLMARLVRDDQLDPTGLPTVVQEFLAASSQLPAWADTALIAEGESLFWDFGEPMISALFCYSLPFCYLGRKGVQVLAMTARLYTNPTRRVVETAQFLVDTLQRGGLGASGGGIRAAQKVRLMHAAIRLQILESGQWKADFDMPINQEDMAGTLMAFSWVVLDGLEKMGFPLDSSSKNGYLHCWKVIGHILGVREDLMPADIDEAAGLALAIQRGQAGDCPEGRMMTAALMGMMREHIPLPCFRNFPETLTRYLLGDAWADLLGIQCPRWEEAVLSWLPILDKGIDAVVERSKVMAAVNSEFTRHLVQAVVLIDRGGNRPSFRIPPELRGRWGIG